MKICQYIRFHMKIISRRLHIETPFTFLDMHTWDMQKVCLQTFRNNRICWKLACFLRNLETSRANNLRILKIKKTKFLGYFVSFDQIKNSLIWPRLDNKNWKNVFKIVFIRLFQCHNPRSGRSSYVYIFWDHRTQWSTLRYVD